MRTHSTPARVHLDGDDAARELIILRALVAQLVAEVDQGLDVQPDIDQVRRYAFALYDELNDLETY